MRECTYERGKNMNESLEDFVINDYFFLEIIFDFSKILS